MGQLSAVTAQVRVCCCLFVGWLTSQHMLVSLRYGSAHSGADQTFYHTQSQYTHTRPTNPRADPTIGNVRFGRRLVIGGVSRDVTS